MALVGHSCGSEGLIKFLKLGCLLLELQQILIPRGVVASKQPVELGGALSRRDIGSVESGSARPLEDGVGDGVLESEDGGGCRPASVFEDAGAGGGFLVADRLDVFAG